MAIIHVRNFKCPTKYCNRINRAPAGRQLATPASQTTSGVANTQAPSESADAESPTRDRETAVGGWTHEYKSGMLGHEKRGVPTPIGQVAKEK